MLGKAAWAARRWISPFPRCVRGQPYGRWVLLSTRGEEDAMTAALTRPVQRLDGCGGRLRQRARAQVVSTDSQDQRTGRPAGTGRAAGRRSARLRGARRACGLASEPVGSAGGLAALGSARADTAARRLCCSPPCRPLRGRRPLAPTAHGGNGNQADAACGAVLVLAYSANHGMAAVLDRRVRSGSCPLPSWLGQGRAAS